jgi:hypothetical protein
MQPKTMWWIVPWSMLTLSSACATLSGEVADSNPLAAADSSDSCSFDSQCPGGSCRFGSCSSLPSDSSNACAFDSQCPGGSCSFGTCSP